MREKKEKKDKKSIVIIEDNVELANFLEELLTEQGYLVSVFNGAQLIQKFDTIKSKPDLFLIDAWLDDQTSGITQVKSLLLDESENKPAILVMSSDQTIEYEVNDLPIEGFIHKPFQIEELLYTIDDAISSND